MVLYTPRFIRAFSLIELLAALFMMMVLIALTLPLSNYFLNAMQSQLVEKDLDDSIQFARQSALTLNQTVSLCASSDALHCADKWSAGWTVRNGDSILSTTHLAESNSLRSRFFPANTHDITFTRDGRLQSMNGTFWYCHAGKIRWAIIISKVGRTKWQYPNVQGEVLDSNDKPLKCF